MSNYPVKKIFYKIVMEASSPLSVGNGNDVMSDADVIMDAQNHPFIPGSSIAGVISHYVEYLNLSSLHNLFSPENCMSPFFISDAKLVGDCTISLRDGICQNIQLKQYVGQDIGIEYPCDGELKEYSLKDFHIDDRTGNLVSDDLSIILDSSLVYINNKYLNRSGKFDYQIVETGAQFEWRVEVTVRENDSLEDIEFYDTVIDKVLKAIDDHDISFGAHTTKGMGYFHVNKVYRNDIETSNVKDILNFTYANMKEYKDWKAVENKPKYNVLSFQLEQISPLIIRDYGDVYIDENGEEKTHRDVQARHIRCHCQPVIPGSSWNGAIRAKLRELKSMLDLNEDYYFDQYFGFIDKNERKISSIITMESIVEGGHEAYVAHNSADRFTGGTVSGALYDELVLVGGSTELELRLTQDVDDWMIGMLLLLGEDMDNGFLSIGGMTSIGRGVFKVTGITYNQKELTKDMKQEYLCKLYNKKKEGER